MAGHSTLIITCMLQNGLLDKCSPAAYLQGRMLPLWQIQAHAAEAAGNAHEWRQFAAAVSAAAHAHAFARRAGEGLQPAQHI